MIGAILRAWRLLERRERHRWLALVPLAVFAAVLEACGTAAVFALIRLIDDPSSSSSFLAGARAVLRPGDDRTFLLEASALVALFYVIKNALLVAMIHRQYGVAGDSIAALSRRLLRGYLELPFAVAASRGSAEMIRNSTDTVHTVVRAVLVSLVNLFAEALVVVAIVAVLFAVAPVTTVLAVAALGATLALVLRRLQRRFVRAGEREEDLKLETLRSLQRSLGGLREVKVAGREAFFVADFGTRHGALASVQATYATLSSVPRLLVETVFICGVLLVVFLVAAGGDSADAVVPVLGLYAYAGFRLIPSANRILASLNNVQYGKAAVDLIHADLERFGEIDEARAAEAEAGVERVAFAERLALEHVGYVHEGSSTPVLEDVSLDVAIGESIGIVGPSGAGKSTLLDLILGLRRPTSGRITVDGFDVSRRIRGWQRRIGYVPQDPFLADDTLRRNVAFGLADAEIDDQKVAEAVRRAQLESLVRELPAGLDTVVGERGIRLSGGERQRVAIARALYHEPVVLVFDEATSALDAATERDLLDAIASLRGVTTSIVVAHRRSTVRSCDRIVFLRSGRLSLHAPVEEVREEAARARRP